MLSHALETGKDFAAALENPNAFNVMEGGQAIYTALDGYPCLATVYAPCTTSPPGWPPWSRSARDSWPLLVL